MKKDDEKESLSNKEWALFVSNNNDIGHVSKGIWFHIMIYIQIILCFKKRIGSLWIINLMILLQAPTYGKNIR